MYKRARLNHVFCQLVGPRRSRMLNCWLQTWTLCCATKKGQRFSLRRRLYGNPESSVLHTAVFTHPVYYHRDFCSRTQYRKSVSTRFISTPYVGPFLLFRRTVTNLLNSRHLPTLPSSVSDCFHCGTVIAHLSWGLSSKTENPWYTNGTPKGFFFLHTLSPKWSPHTL